MIIAVDFDGTLCENAWPEIGAANNALIDFLLERKQSYGDKLILWTMREGGALDEAIAWCARYGLNFDAVNDNLQALKDAYHNNPRKVYADCYIDDHNAMYLPTDPRCWHRERRFNNGETQQVMYIYKSKSFPQNQE